MTNYNKNIFKTPPPPKQKITLVQVYKFNRIYSDKGRIKVEVYEKTGKYYLVFKGKITTYIDYNICFEEAKRISEKGSLSDSERPEN